ncbi:MAG: phosphatidylglycerol lysyltransferase domain-containing protein [Prevotellaceae bacterium]|jgi:hypothetical protein|nr:phosphatidylglycerol lysyltransferase domain-containing protein [Prevotellaceae bacterium]
MLNFKTITIEDKKAIDHCLSYKPSRSCNYCFTNLVAWNVRFNSEFAIVQDTLFVKFEDGGQTFYLFPTGKLSLEKAFEMLKNDAQERKTPLVIKAVSEEMWQDINATFPNEFAYTTERHNYEYIYLAEKLIKLNGKKLQSKRNHINRFKFENQDWEFRSIESREDCYQCWNMLKEWENEQESADTSLQFEYLASKTMLCHFDELGLQGGMILANGQIVAFSVGEPLTNDTFVMHIEKAHKDINGGYAIINQQMAEHIAANYKYINREEDLGIDTLRKAKLSYQPDILLAEGSVRQIGLTIVDC